MSVWSIFKSQGKVTDNKIGRVNEPLAHLHLSDVKARVDAENFQLPIVVRVGREVEVAAAQGPGFDSSPPARNVEDDNGFDVGQIDLLLSMALNSSFFVADDEAKWARAFVPGKPFQPSLIFVSKARA